MPSAVDSAGPDELDNLVNNYDKDVDDFLRDLPLGRDAAQDTTIQPAKDVDEEIKVRKKRIPVPKLDESRLLSDAGVTKLRWIAKTKLKFKGKGHEFSDIGRLLNVYQLWLDDLYPRAKFKDALGMVEKVGHSKRMQITRRAWIDATKPNRREPSPERLEDVEMSGGLGERDANETSVANGDESGAPPFGDLDTRQNDIPDGDELNALMGDGGPAATRSQNQNVRNGPFDEEDDEPDEDELDALLAESAGTNVHTSVGQQQKQSGPFEEEENDAEPDEDELDALLAEQTTTPPARNSTRAAPDVTDHQRIDDFADEEEVMAEMGGMW